MSERKTQPKSLSLLVRIRPTSERTVQGREINTAVPAVQEASVEQKPEQSVEHYKVKLEEQAAALSYSAEKDKHIQQVKELVRLCGLLRADLSPDEVLQQIAASTVACTGFRILNINLLDPSGKIFTSAASIGLSEENIRILKDMPFAFEAFVRTMRPEFRISDSYFIPHTVVHEIFADLPVIKINTSKEEHGETGLWHPEDLFNVPLYSPRKQELVGFLSLDDPEDGKIPTQETVEMTELFASKAALAIDNAHIFQEHEAERLALESGIAELRCGIELLAQGDMRPQITSQHPRLQPIADALNTTVNRIGTILLDMRGVSHTVDEHMQMVQQNSEMLALDIHQQEIQVAQISRTIGEFAQMMRTISEQAAHLSKTAIDGVDVTNEAQATVDRTVEGMSLVREATLQSARTMKNLSESGQEINETISVMNDLTMRMHLLALNAAIESTRAGEHGQGFAVIAQETRSLAMSSADASRKVGEYIHTIQQETTQASQSVEQSTQEVVKQTELVMLTGVALDAIGIVTDQLSNLIEGICNTAESQSLGTQLVVTAINEILHMTGDITRHMHEMQQSTSRLVEFSDALRSRLSMIHLREP